MCDTAVKDNPYSLRFVPDWFVILQEMWCEDFDDNDFLIRWRHAYQKRNVQKSKIKEELMLIAWRPSRWWN